VANDADHYIHMYTLDGQCFDSLDWRRVIHDCIDDVPDVVLRTLSNGIKLASNGLAKGDM
jgi:hypothetical protein